MQTRPTISWGIAKAVAGLLEGQPPATTRPQAAQAVASLRLAARRAGHLALEASHLGGLPAINIKITDRESWGDSAHVMIEELLDRFEWGEGSHRLSSKVKGLGNGLAGGFLLAFMQRNLLGQYDPFSRPATLYLLAPNIVENERVRGLDPEDFRLWVSVHEQTHAVQFSAAPWLRDYLLERLLFLAEDDSGILETLRSLTAHRDLESGNNKPSIRAALGEIIGVMTFLEGHADHIAEEVGRVHIPTWAALRRSFARSRVSAGPMKWLPILNKNAQYRDGLRFCRKVSNRVGTGGLALVFDGPSALPTRREIAEPAAWLRRVHGAA